MVIKKDVSVQYLFPNNLKLYSRYIPTTAPLSPVFLVFPYKFLTHCSSFLFSEKERNLGDHPTLIFTQSFTVLFPTGCIRMEYICVLLFQSRSFISLIPLIFFQGCYYLPNFVEFMTDQFNILHSHLHAKRNNILLWKRENVAKCSHYTHSSINFRQFQDTCKTPELCECVCVFVHVYVCVCFFLGVCLHTSMHTYYFACFREFYSSRLSSKTL